MMAFLGMSGAKQGAVAKLSAFVTETDKLCISPFAQIAPDPVPARKIDTHKTSPVRVSCTDESRRRPSVVGKPGGLWLSGMFRGGGAGGVIMKVVAG